MNTNSHQNMKNMYSPNALMAAIAFAILVFLIVSNYRMNQKLSDLKESQSNTLAMTQDSKTNSTNSMMSAASEFDSDIYDATQARFSRFRGSRGSAQPYPNSSSRA